MTTAMLGHARNDGVLCEMTNQTRLQTPHPVQTSTVITHLNSRELNFCFVALCENTESTEFRKCLKEFAAVHAATVHACAVISSSRRQHRVYARVSMLSLTSLSFAGSGQLGAGSSSDSTMAGAYKVTMAR